MRRFGVILLMLLALLGGSPMVHAAEPDNNQTMLLKLFGSAPLTEDMFAPGMLAQVPFAQIEAVLSAARKTIGIPESVEPSGTGYLVKSSSYTQPVEITLDAQGRIAALVLRPPMPVFDSADEVLAAIEGLPGKVGYLVLRDGEPLHALGADTAMAVGSAFKLAVLAVVADEIAAGRLGWDTVVRLKPEEVSLPSGVLQTMPAGSPLTVHTLAAFMIAQSDNTATDMLMDLIGRDKVSAKLGVDFALKTVEFFKLKADPALRLRFADTDAAGKARIVGEMAAMPLPRVGDVLGPLDDGIEWYASLATLCRLAGEVKGLDVFEINPGIARKADWARIAFKGGSEVGVTAFVTALADKAGADYCIAAAWNDHKVLDDIRFSALYGALIDKIGGK
jgi:hypothetical protein